MPKPTARSSPGKSRLAEARSTTLAAKEPLSVCINTQTPLIQFLALPQKLELRPPIDGTSEMEGLVEGVDYRFSPGGVTRMVFPLVRRLLHSGVLGDAHWISLNPTAPPTMRFQGVTLHSLGLDAERMANYGRVKESIWGTLHGLDTALPDDEVFWSTDFSDYGYYNRITAERMRALDRENDFDLFYVHDFQQLPVGGMLETLKPKLFRWHIPFDETQIPEPWRERLSSYFNSYDVVVVSTRRYLAELKRFGHTGTSRTIYPYIDPADYTRPAPEAAQATCRKFGLAPTDPFILVVGRMDPMKGQDRAIRAFEEVARSRPELRLVLVGNGSFSSSGSGMGLSKSANWRAKLEALVRSLDLRDRVIFTGHVPQPELDGLYERCRFTVLPSVREGFGLVVVEGWIHDKPVIVTDRAGVAELIKDGSNGMVFDPDRPDGLVGKMEKLLDSDSLCRKLGREGARTARLCSIEAAALAEAELFGDLVES
ncbi:MAG TPA: glycosyltransferase family 4 protein [Thermoplasmata archaeon]|nr:glycosyltransferase family 4 protein [Thermoplasmata archaeon]